MILRSGPAALLPLLAGLLAACGTRPAAGTLAASWVGADTGALSGRPVVTWCRDGRRLEVTLVREDLGIGLVLYPADSLGAGQYPAFDPGADTVRRPSAAAALRWFTEQAIEGFQSDSGALVLEPAGPGYSARFEFRLHSLDDAKQLRLSGTLTQLVPGACPADSLPAAGPTG